MRCLLHGQTRRMAAGHKAQLQSFFTLQGGQLTWGHQDLGLPTVHVTQEDQHKPNTRPGLPAPFSGYHTSLGCGFCSRSQDVKCQPDVTRMCPILGEGDVPAAGMCTAAWPRVGTESRGSALGPHRAVALLSSPPKISCHAHTPALAPPLAMGTVLPEPLRAAPRRESGASADSICIYLASCPGKLPSGPCISLDSLPNVSGSAGEHKIKRR